MTSSNHSKKTSVLKKLKRYFLIVYVFVYQNDKFDLVSADIDSVSQFLDEISSDVSKESSRLEDAVVLKEG